MLRRQFRQRLGFWVAWLLTVQTKQSKAKPEEFVALPIENIYYIIYPYRNSEIKKNLAAKIVNKDGTDCILLFNVGDLAGGRSAKKYMSAFDRLGIPIKNGLDWDFGNRYCDHRFLDLFHEMEVNEASAFCAYCGSRVRTSDAFCGACGRKIDD